MPPIWGSIKILIEPNKNGDACFPGGFMRRTGLGVLFSCLVLILAPAGLAQNAQNNGTIQGTVLDAAGANVTGAEVTAFNDETGFTRTATTSSEGLYAFTELPPGHYHITVKKDGFKTENRSGIELHLGSVLVVNANLTVGAVAETVTVEATNIEVDTTSGALGVLTEGQQVRELPLNGLNFIGLTLLVPGASTQDGFNTTAKGLEGGTDISFSGGQRTGNLFTVDGAPINDTGSQRTIFVYPALDSIDEFKIVTNSYGPEYGQSGGAQVNIITKHGTNDWHGSLFYFGRNDALTPTISSTRARRRNCRIPNCAGTTLAAPSADPLKRTSFSSLRPKSGTVKLRELSMPDKLPAPRNFPEILRAHRFQESQA